ncbi:MAG TPA: hypothetical protein DCL54_16665 [Alphaproteobacteria bacterium]|nr:hypothetical protein [Alphaproteobacteria bacterium]HAJ48208.1 hypothetical protein [Alphaproteobacteria bacterium]
MNLAATAVVNENRTLKARLNPEVLSSSILIVDDQEINLDFMSAMLADVGFSNIRLARDGLSALELIEADPPDLLILDVMMPIMSGIDLCKHLRRDPRLAELPVLVQTGLSTVHDRIEIFGAGATDLILKPINGLELISRVSLHVERKLLIEGLTRSRDRLATELSAARDLQFDLLPSAQEQSALLQRFGLDLASTFSPSSELGGDMWGLLQRSDGGIGVFIADFAGHGVQAAMNTFRLHTLLQDVRQLPGRPGELLTDLNRRLRHLLPVGQFATMTCAAIDPRRQTLSWASAGSPPPLLKLDGEDWKDLASAGLPLGIDDSTAYETHETAFPAGAALVLYSDALSETPTSSGERLEDQGVRNLLRGSEGESNSQAALSTVLAKFQAMLSGPLCDDLTTIIIRNQIHRLGEERPRDAAE